MLSAELGRVVFFVPPFRYLLRGEPVLVRCIAYSVYQSAGGDDKPLFWTIWNIRNKLVPEVATELSASLPSVT